MKVPIPAYYFKMDSITTLPIKKIVNEAKGIKSFYFEHKLEAKPGQFILLWLPRINEKPFSISYQDNGSFGITVSCVGPFTDKLCTMKEGDFVGFRGAFGNGYNIEGKNIVLVGGGYGTAPLSFLAEEAASKGINVNFIIGAKSQDYILFKDRFKDKAKLHFTTDDGSFGRKGFTTDVLKELLEKENIAKIFACGPEVMLKKVIEISDEFNVKCEISLERILKCGLGLCGNCVLDPNGLRVCKEGPVFDKEEIKQIKDFGAYKRDFSGKKIRL